VISYVERVMTDATTTQEPQTLWTLTKRELVAILAFSSTDECRLNLYAVCFDRETGDILATDGHMALCVGKSWRPTGSGEGYAVIHRAALEAAAKVAKTGDLIRIEIVDDSVTITAGPLASTVPFATTTFPPLKTVYPKEVLIGGCAHAFNASYLARMEKITRATGMTKTHSIELYPGPTNLDPMMMVHSSPENGAVWSVMIMPMRFDATVPARSVDADRLDALEQENADFRSTANKPRLRKVG
jgi:hypothetical protein